MLIPDVDAPRDHFCQDLGVRLGSAVRAAIRLVPARAKAMATATATAAMLGPLCATRKKIEVSHTAHMSQQGNICVC